MTESLLLSEVELMETKVNQIMVYALDTIASFIGSGINGNRTGYTSLDKITLISLLLSEVELMETFVLVYLSLCIHNNRFFYRKWN